MYSSMVGLAEAIGSGQFSPTDVVAACLERIDEKNPTLNAFVTVDHDGARQAARDSERRLASGQGRPLEGVPIAIKDDTAVKGLPLSEGTAVVPSVTPEVDAHLVRCLRDAGAVIVGKTNLPEFGSIAVTESARWGACRNPWKAEHTPGGSSGGSAAAVAAGLVPAAHGCDGGGSLRIPASCCGLFTMKPTKGRISISPFGSDSPVTTHGYLTRTVLDNATLFDLTVGPVQGDQAWMPVVDSFVQQVGEAERSPRLTIGWTDSPPMAFDVHPSCSEAVREAADLCQNLGHAVEQFTPDWIDPLAEEQFLDLWSVLVGSFVEQLVSQGGSLADAEPHNRALLERGQSLSATAYFNVLAALRARTRRIMATWSTYDVILTPTLAQPPLRIGELFQDVDDDPLSVLHRTFAFTPFTPVVNVTGQPAAQVPMSWHEGLPIGVQLIGRQGDEATLFRLSAELERIHPWTDLWPQA